jgi:hypothetical protein
MITNPYWRTPNLAVNIEVLKQLLEYKCEKFYIEKAYYINARNTNLSFARIGIINAFTYIKNN